MKILICTDGSEQAERALRFGAEIAAATQAEVTLLTIQETEGASEPILNSLRRGQEWLAQHKVAAQVVTKAGEPIAEILRRTEEVAYDLVLIGAVRKGNLGPFSMSSKVYKIVKLIKPPVLVVMGNPQGLKRIVVCSGGKGYIEGAFGLLEKLAQSTGASVTLLHVMAQPPAIYADLRNLEEEAREVLASNSELGRNLRREQQALTALGISTRVRLRRGFVTEEIFKEIGEGQYDLIVAGSSLSTGPLRTYVLGDITREIVNRAVCPVLVARHLLRPPNLKERLKDFFHGFSLHSPEIDRDEAKRQAPPG